jgi:hypothetical protein
MKKLEKTLMEELARYNAINRYTKNLMEQGEELPPPPADAGMGGEELPPPPADAGMGGELPPPVDAAGGGELPPPSDTGMGEELPPPVDDVEEIDITDLVNMTKSIKKDMEDKKSESDEVVGKMDTVFTKLDDLENKLSQMDAVLSKIDQLGQRMEDMREKTPQEKLELRSLDSYPFNQNPQQFFANKQGEMRQSGKNEYILTKQDIDNYSNEMIRNSFNSNTEEDEFKFEN